MDLSRLLLRPETIIFLIPIVAIITGGIVAIVKIVIAHRERMALIEQGLHPDHPPEEVVPDDDSVGVP